MDSNIKKLMDTVVAKDYCIGCGICASLNGSPLTMKLDENGKFRPFINDVISKEEMTINPLEVCPFSNDNKNETEIGEELFGEIKNINFNKFTGYSIKSYAGYVLEGEYREKGSSGGMGNWICAQLLKNKMVDGIIHIKSADKDTGLLFNYQISYNEKDLLSGAKSKYYPIELSEVIKLVKEEEGRFAVIGIPCYIKSLRLLANHDDEVKNRIKYYIGLVCGHLKSDMFAKSIGWQLGIEPNDLETIDFRKKIEGRAASDYGVEVTGRSLEGPQVYSSRTKEVYTTNWGHGLFKYNACEFCDDVLAETADITVGDAWLPEYASDGMGTNIITVRNPDIYNILKENKREIHLEEISDEKVYQSQAGGFRHRRDGLSYRLHLADKANEWRPVKRVKPSNNLSGKRKKIYKKRMELFQESFEGFKIAERERNFEAFVSYMEPIIDSYDKLVEPSIARKTMSKLKRQVKQIVKK